MVIFGKLFHVDCTYYILILGIGIGIGIGTGYSHFVIVKISWNSNLILLGYIEFIGNILYWKNNILKNKRIEYKTTRFVPIIWVA